ncbi:MAG: ribosome biogenesis GTPase Der [Planctomycetes bacterium]|nr:ribosome biogenesis GTPase Der [Planctomycetota bacterium]
MSLPQIAIIGRPNVGKSSLLNRLVRRRVSIVDPTPGVTRDRVSVLLELEAPRDREGEDPKYAELVDTGGYGVYTAEGKRFDDAGVDLAALTEDIEAQINIAREQADVLLFVIDAQAGVTALDETIARMLREGGDLDKLLMVANKVDGESWIAHGLEAAGLGFGEPIVVSASNGYGARQLEETLYERVELAGSGTEAPEAPEMRVAIVGKRNAGKSTLINTLAGEPRVVVSEIAGTTRDSIDVRFEIDGRTLVAIDTAGARRRKSLADDVEYYAYHRMLRAIRRADVVVLLVDATDEVSQVDQKLTQELQRQFKPTVIVVNKCDRLAETNIGPEDYLQYLTEQLRGLDYAPIVFISAEEGDGVSDMVAMAFNLHRQAGHREATGSLNRVVEEILKKRGPSSRLGTQARLFYVSQVDVNPPTIVLKVNHPKLFTGQYERYLMNRLREELPYSEVPIRLVFSERDRMEVNEMKQRGRSRDFE